MLFALIHRPQVVVSNFTEFRIGFWLAHRRRVKVYKPSQRPKVSKEFDLSKVIRVLARFQSRDLVPLVRQLILRSFMCYQTRMRRRRKSVVQVVLVIDENFLQKLLCLIVTLRV